MSTTPMHRPFLVRHDLAPSSHPRSGLYLVPAPKRRKSLISYRSRDIYGMAAVAAALLLLLTI